MANEALSQQNEARQALADVADVERARVARVRTPRWYWHVSGATFFLLEASILLPIAWRIAVTLIAVVGGGMGIGAYQAKTGYRPKGVDKEGVKLAAFVVVTVVAIAGVCLLIGQQTDWSGMAVVAGAVTYAVIVGFGPLLERVARR